MIIIYRETIRLIDIANIEFFEKVENNRTGKAFFAMNNHFLFDFINKSQ
jgi:hypothetical protein